MNILEPHHTDENVTDKVIADKLFQFARGFSNTADISEHYVIQNLAENLEAFGFPVKQAYAFRSSKIEDEALQFCDTVYLDPKSHFTIRYHENLYVDMDLRADIRNRSLRFRAGYERNDNPVWDRPEILFSDCHFSGFLWWKDISHEQVYSHGHLYSEGDKDYLSPLAALMALDYFANTVLGLEDIE